MRPWTPLLILAFGCGTAPPQPAAPQHQAAVAGDIANTAGPAATAVIESRSGSTLNGRARFVAAKDGLGVHVEVKGGEPGTHGVHIHEKGDCSDPTAANAGAHFDPTKTGHHGSPKSTDHHHAGDLGNIEVGANGEGTLDEVVPGLSLSGNEDGVSGRALVVHQTTDDLATDPAGNSGARIGCGLILAPSLP